MDDLNEEIKIPGPPLPPALAEHKAKRQADERKRQQLRAEIIAPVLKDLRRAVQEKRDQISSVSYIEGICQNKQLSDDVTIRGILIGYSEFNDYMVSLLASIDKLIKDNKGDLDHGQSSSQPTEPTAEPKPKARTKPTGSSSASTKRN